MDIFYTAMENTMAHKILNLNQTQIYDKTVLEKTFSGCRSALEIDEIFKEKRRRIIFTCSPSYCLENTGEHMTGRMECDAYVYEVTPGNACRLMMSQMSAVFENTHGTANICEFRWKVLQTMEPWVYSEESADLANISVITPEQCDCLKTLGSRDYGEIRDEAVRQWDQLWLQEITASGRQLYGPGGLPENIEKPLVGLTSFVAADLLDSSNFMSAQDGCRARAAFTAEVFGIGNNSSHGSVVARCFYLTEYEMEKSKDQWIIRNTTIRPLLRLPDTPYEQGKRYDKISVDIVPWILDNQRPSGKFTEDSYAVENIIHSWVYACRQGQLCRFYETYMKHEEFTPTMLIRSQGAKTARLVGEKEILGKLSGMDANYHPGMLTYHCATTPLIRISEDGTRATGTWFDHSATNLSNGDINQRRIPYMVFVARYRHEFRKIAGKWYLTDFFWEPLISLADWMWDRDKDDAQRNETVQGPQIIKDESSPTGYYVKFHYKDPKAGNIGIIGDWMFSDIHHSSRWKSAATWPHQWKPGDFPHALLGLKKTPEALTTGQSQTSIDPSKFEFDWDILKRGLYDMNKVGDEGDFELVLPLPSGIFNYRFVLDLPDGNPLKMVTVPDPANPPVTVGEKGQAFSQVYVPFDKERQIVDRSIELPLESGMGGTITSFEYTTAPEFDNGKVQYGAVYLPEGYDPHRSCPYPVLYLSHGGSGNAGDWPAQGGLKNIMDHLIREGHAQPMAVVVMDNEEFHWDNSGKCIPNLTRYLIPWAESHFNIGKDMKQRAFAGFSAGGFLAYEVMAGAAEMFHYIGVWSGGRRVELLPDPKANPCLQVHIGAGRYDDAFYSFGYKLEDLLGELGIPFTSFFPEGGHQWSVWRQLLEDFAGRVLWK